MSEGMILIFESTEAAIVRAVETALTKAKIAFDLRFERPTLDRQGPNKPPKQFFVAASVEQAARAIVEAAVLRRSRVESLQPKKPRAGSGFGDDGGGGGDVFVFGDFGDFGGGDGGDGGHH